MTTLKLIDICNFRSLKAAKIDFDHRCRVLVGINESGKSNILRALALIDPNTVIQDEDLREPLKDEEPIDQAFVDFEFEIKNDVFEEKCARFIEGVIGDHDQAVFDDGRFSSIYSFLMQENEYVYRVDLITKKRTIINYRTSAKLNGPFCKKVHNAPNAGNVTLSDGTIRSYQGLRFINKQAAEVVDENFLKPCNLDDIRDMLLEEVGKIIAESLPSCVRWEYSESNLLPAVIPIAQFSANPKTCTPLKRMFELAGYEDISAAITHAQSKQQGLRSLLERIANAATRHIHQVWSEASGVHVDLINNGANIEATFRDSSNWYGMSRRSDGFKRFVTFLLLVSATEKAKKLSNVLYLHDEPDIGMHPSGARHLMQELIRISQSNYVVYSTHSVFMIDRDLIERHIIVTKVKEMSSIAQATSSNYQQEEVLYNALGFSLFEVLKRDNLIFEGWRDRKLFDTFLEKRAVPKSTRDHFEKIGRCHVRGVKEIHNITPILELAQRGYVVISDGDHAGLEGQKNHRGLGPWRTYSELLKTSEHLTAEDFIVLTALVGASNACIDIYAITQKLKIADINPSAPRLRQIESWAVKHGCSHDHKKKFLDEVKSKIFDNLKPSDIEDSYDEVVKSMMTLIQGPAVLAGRT